MQLTEKDSDRKVVLVVGTHLTIRLKAQLGTGYSWQFEALDVQVLESSGEPTTETIEEGKLGAAEMQVFRFTAKGVGTTALAFHYARHWEKDVKPMKTITFQVEVKPKS
jgi:predicted secreted protein